MRNTIIFFSVFAALGAAVVGLQYIPAVGFIGTYVGAPYYFGALLHLGLLAMLLLAAIGWLPRLLMIVPLAVWLAGGVVWYRANQAVEAETAALEKPVPLKQLPREVRIRGASQIATELVADYQIETVYTEFHRHVLVNGSDCTPPPKHDPQRLLWAPPKLRARNECVISQRIDEPPAKLVEVSTIKGEAQTTSSGGKRVRMEVTVYDPEQDIHWVTTRGSENIPAPVFYPIVGFFYGSQAGERGTILELWGKEIPLVRGAGDDLPNEATARFIGQTLGLTRRR
jgi:hypothetical protein